MSDNEVLVPRVNFFDGQRVTEEDLDVEQIHNLSVTSNIIKNFHGSGVLKNSFFEEKILLDTKFPGKYTGGSENLSKSDIESGNFDGLPITLDIQPSDQKYGNRIEIELENVKIRGKYKTSIMILGRSFNGVGDPGELVSEIITFGKNTKKISKNYYLKIFAIFFNNFSGGTGRTNIESSKDSLNLISESAGRAKIREAESLMVYPASSMISQKESPNFELSNFITYDEGVSIELLVQEALGSEASSKDLYLEFTSDKIALAKNGDTAVEYGQKFLSKTNNIQKIDILLSVEKDEDRDIGKEYDFSGDIVVSIYKLSTETKCVTDVVPDNLIDFDPDISPIVEISYSQKDLIDLGYELDSTPRVVSIDFSGTLVADPNIEPSIEANSYYAFMISRRGDSRVGSIVFEKGYDKSKRKESLGRELNVVEKYGKQESRFVEFDPETSRYIDDRTRSLWFEVHSDCVEITSGVAYSYDGYKVVLPKSEDFVAGAEVSLTTRNIPLRTIANDEYNYVIMTRSETFTSPNVHPRTGNFVFTRIVDSIAISVVNASELEDLLEDSTPIILARVLDRNTRDAQTIEGTISTPGLIYRDHIWIVNPTSEMLSENLVNRIIVPDLDCQCASKYRIVNAECMNIMAGDLNRDGEISEDDILSVLELVGNTLNSEHTERRILGGEISAIDFILSDLNSDDTIDGFDIELMEDAIDGYVNFSVDERINFLRLDLENVLESLDDPTLFEDISFSGTTSSGTDSLQFVVEDERTALALRVGDKVSIPSASVDAGDYLVYSKVVAEDAKSITVGVTSLDGEAIEFIGSGAFNVVVTSGTDANIFADNLNFLNIPYSSSNFGIYYVQAPFEERFIDVCDLRRFVAQSFIEEPEDDCLCAEIVCIEQDPCSPEYKNQLHIPSDIYITDGEILSEPGVPYHGDIEYATVRMPLPPGSMEDCQVNLYETFVRSDDGSCKTAAGYPAMLYSDGTYVGCNDSGDDTDISKGRVKFTSAIASLYVDALVDGYATDGISTESEVPASKTCLSSEFVNRTYNDFLDWVPTPSVPSSFSLDPSGSISLQTVNVPSALTAGFRAPTSDNFDGDFLLDVKAYRARWESDALLSGTVKSYILVNISNDDSTTSRLELGWYEDFALGGTKVYYLFQKHDSSGSLIHNEKFEINSPEALTENVLFRIKRVGEVCSAYYFLPDSNSFIDNPTGQYIRVGSNHLVHPGSGQCAFSIESMQESSPTAGFEFVTHWASMLVRSEYSALEAGSEVLIGTTDSANVLQSAAVYSIPLPITRRTNIQSANLVLTLTEDIDLTDTSTDVFFVVPYDAIDTSNLSTHHEYAWSQDFSHITAFIPGAAASGAEISIDVLDAVKSMMSDTTGHLPGYEKSFWIVPAFTTTSSFSVSASARLDIEYVDTSTGVIFKIGIDIDTSTGIASFRTRNILYDSMINENRTVIEFGVFLKKSAFRNSDLEIGISELNRIGIGSCVDDEALLEQGSECFFIVGSTATGTFVEGPFSCTLHSPYIP